MRPIFTSGVGCAEAMWLAIDQIFCLAPRMRPDMLPVVSRTKTTSTLGLGGGGASAWATGAGAGAGAATGAGAGGAAGTTALTGGGDSGFLDADFLGAAIAAATATMIPA